MARLNDFLPRIKPHLKGCPDTTIKNALLHILRDICKKTMVWEADIEHETVAGVNEFTLSTGEGTEVAIIQWVRERDGHYLRNQLIPQRETANAAPRIWQHSKRRRIAFFPTPKDAQVYDVRLALMPSLDAQEIPDEVFSEVSEYAVWGVLADLMSMVSEEWANVDLAMLNGRRYEAFLSERRVSSLGGYTAADIRAKGRRFV